jgi:hypothetical protein
MTAKQRTRFYFPAWAAAARVHGWKTEGGRIIGQRQECWASPELNAVYQRIWNLAEHWAANDARALTPDDFRHACHVAALGRDASSANLGNDQVDKVVALFKLLADPDDLRATMAWMSPDEARRRRMLWWIRSNCVESYVVAVCREKFHTDEPAGLRFDQLSQLHMTLRNRRNALKTEPENQPF